MHPAFKDLLLDPLIEDLVGIVSRELADRGLGMKAVHRGQDRSAGEKQEKRTEFDEDLGCDLQVIQHDGSFIARVVIAATVNAAAPPI